MGGLMAHAAPEVEVLQAQFVIPTLSTIIFWPRAHASCLLAMLSTIPWFCRLCILTEILVISTHSSRCLSVSPLDAHPSVSMEAVMKEHRAYNTITEVSDLVGCLVSS